MLKRFLPVLCVLVLCLSLTIPTVFAADLPPCNFDSLPFDYDDLCDRVCSKSNYCIVEKLDGSYKIWMFDSCSDSYRLSTQQIGSYDYVFSGPGRVTTATYKDGVFSNVSTDNSTYNWIGWSEGDSLVYAPFELYNVDGVSMVYPERTYPNPPSGVSGTDYALWYYKGYYYSLINFLPSNSRVEASGYEYKVLFNLESSTPLYRYDSNGWALVSSQPVGGSSFMVSSNADIIYYPEKLTYNGADFFVPPLTLEQATEKGLESLLETMGAAVLILVFLGVSLMALVIGYNLFGKVLLRFLN